MALSDTREMARARGEVSRMRRRRRSLSMRASLDSCSLAMASRNTASSEAMSAISSLPVRGMEAWKSPSTMRCMDDARPARRDTRLRPRYSQTNSNGPKKVNMATTSMVWRPLETAASVRRSFSAASASAAETRRPTEDEVRATRSRPSSSAAARRAMVSICKVRSSKTLSGPVPSASTRRVSSRVRWLLPPPVASTSSAKRRTCSS